MKSIISIFLFLLLSSQCLAVPEKKMEYFYGQANIINLNSNIESDQSQMLLLRKTTIPEQKLIIETATTPDLNGSMKDHTVFLNVAGQALIITDADKSIEGSGSVHGEQWNWKLLKFSMVTKRGGIKIDDVNFRTSDRLIARKTLSMPDGKPFMLWEVEAKEISASEYLQIYSQMHSQK